MKRYNTNSTARRMGLGGMEEDNKYGFCLGIEEVKKELKTVLEAMEDSDMQRAERKLREIISSLE